MTNLDSECAEETCSLRAMSRGYCNIHYQRLRKAGKILPKERAKRVCQDPDCHRGAKARGFCDMHYQAARKAGTIKVIQTSLPRLNPDGTPRECDYPPCKNAVVSRGHCETHYRQLLRGEELSPAGEISGCPTPNCGRGMGPYAKRCSYCNHFRKRYSLTWERVDFLWATENRHCYNPGCDSTESLHMDHDHSCCNTGRDRFSCGECLRGWLCRACNTALGLLKENPRRIEGLLESLESFKK